MRCARTDSSFVYKKTQKTPKKDIEIALKRKKELEK
ncbi:MAG: hypothetical protein QG567_1500 [Campylobacterota bacterium]|nr:hypothetical protein [Campylobacterota bacterium]MDQ1340343.1 hypothetical protein [Campylobacterota bacterium]